MNTKAGAVDNDELILLDLTSAERDFLFHGLIEWGGPGRMSDALAIAIGFDDAEDFRASKGVLADAILDGTGLSAQDWRRALAAAEICFASDTLGVGLEWEDVGVTSDEVTFEAMRSVQIKVTTHHIA
ncbi:hypothetical protein GTV32_19615 [Gordonia sp. SID5947]|uniref:hypothetical protein n=1 Tax=Gordonia sp. SID5947 TaxID=2690315 RepID=UPI001372244E|nr:hypothetical protein [Gordonia sp. SID5947]MYR08372.1 hypothetical protein [Gordonia sp. SID5947]